MHVKLDPGRPLRAQPALGHNRWHPALAPVATVAPGEVVTLDLRDSMDGQVTAASRDEDCSRSRRSRIR